MLGKLLQSAHEQPQRTSLLLRSKGELERLPAPGGPVALEGDTRRDHLVIARKEMRDETARDLERRAARVEATEEELDEAARDLCREHALGRRVEAADVEGPRVAQRGRRGAGRERLVHVHEVERHGAEQALDRACHVHGQRHRAAAPGCPDRNALPHRQHPHETGGEQRRRIVLGGPNQPARLLHERARPARRDDEHGVAVLRERVRDALNVLVDLAPSFPRVGRYLRDRERAARVGRGHRAAAVKELRTGSA